DSPRGGAYVSSLLGGGGGTSGGSTGDGSGGVSSGAAEALRAKRNLQQGSGSSDDKTVTGHTQPIMLEPTTTREFQNLHHYH
ncbi:unnamed protein product, partial [Amoebophrya sp. A25]